MSQAGAKPTYLRDASAQVPTSGQGSETSGDVDALERLARLKTEFDANAARLPDANEGWIALLRRRLASLWRPRRRYLKAALGLAIVAAVGWIPVRSLLQTTSTEAVVNARLITLRAPIEGEVEPVLGNMSVGTDLNVFQPLMRVVNRRAERSRLVDLRRQIEQLEREREAVVARITDLSVLQVELNSQVRAFKEGRLKQLIERAAELASELAAVRASRDAADKALARVRPMASSGSVTAATMEKYVRDAHVTAENYEAVSHRLAAVEVELTAARQGTFIGDNYNDRPQSSQRADEVGQRLSELTADLRSRDSHIFDLRKELSAEAKLYKENSDAEIVSPIAGRVWEVLTAPGETVVRGQELIRLLDCSGVVVTATVSESIYNRLFIGQPASFRFRGEEASHAGRIVGLTGIASAPANLAIQPGALAKDSFRVTVKLDDLTATSQCKVGRTGRVAFGA
jgi:multidrug resistance efflux pump